MTTAEFSVEFDILYNNITSGQAPGLTEYEKSVFLTQAEEMVVSDMYAGRQTGPFEANEETRAYLHTLIKERVYEDSEISVETGLFGKERLVNLDQDTLYIISENAVLKDSSLSCDGSDERSVDVYPVAHDILYRTLKSPFRGANERRVLRLDIGGIDNDALVRKVKLFTKYDISKYIVRYLSKPEPIILKDAIEDGSELSINGKTDPQTCKLPEMIHRSVLLKAVEIAKAIWKS